MQRFIKVNTQVEGTHCWKNAPAEVGYLKSEHRHMFGVSVEMEVRHNDRELEFIMVKHAVNDYFEAYRDKVSKLVRFGESSCEQIAEHLASHLTYLYGKRQMIVEVNEDGENGATVVMRSSDSDKTQPEPEHDETNGTDPLFQFLNDLFGLDIDPDKCEEGHDNGLDFTTYQGEAYQAIQGHESNREEMFHWAVGLGEEAGEVLGVLKHQYYGGEAKGAHEHLIEELGDVLWYVSALATAAHISLNDVAVYNLAKLHKRFPDGKFDMERSQNRHNIDGTYKKEN